MAASRKLSETVLLHLLHAAPNAQAPTGQALADLEKATRLNSRQIAQYYDHFRNEGVPQFLEQDRNASGTFGRISELPPRCRVHQVALLDPVQASSLGPSVSRLIKSANVAAETKKKEGKGKAEEKAEKPAAEAKAGLEGVQANTTSTRDWAWAWFDGDIAEHGQELFDILSSANIVNAATKAMRAFVQETHPVNHLHLFDKWFGKGPRSFSAVSYDAHTKVGMDTHVDYNTFGTVVLSLTGDENKEGALVVEEFGTRTNSSCVMKPGECVIFTRQRHYVPAVTRKQLRVSVNLFF